MALDYFIDWCDDSYLDLNVGKTNEMIEDFRRQGYAQAAMQIYGEPVEIVTSYKYLGTVFEDSLKWDLNTEAITKKKAPATPSAAEAQIFSCRSSYS